MVFRRDKINQKRIKTTEKLRENLFLSADIYHVLEILASHKIFKIQLACGMHNDDNCKYTFGTILQFCMRNWYTTSEYLKILTGSLRALCYRLRN